jgi:hypothetical protein
VHRRETTAPFDRMMGQGRMETAQSTARAGRVRTTPAYLEGGGFSRRRLETVGSLLC